MDDPEKDIKIEETKPEAKEETGETAASAAPETREPAGAQPEAVPEQPKSPAPDEDQRDLEPSPELKNALDEAIKNYEQAEGKKKQKKPEEEVRRTSEEEMKLKLEILDLKHKVRGLEQEIEKKVKDVRQNFELGQQLKNQFEAHKSRVMKEKAEWFNYGHEPVLKDMLQVVDNFERALSHANRPEDFASLKQGIELILRQLLQTLEKHGVKPITSLNQNFDPNFHEAMSQTISAEHPDHTVVMEHSRGYMLKDRLLRPARVTISKRPEEAAPAAEPKKDIETANENNSGEGLKPESNKTGGN